MFILPIETITNHTIVLTAAETKLVDKRETKLLSQERYNMTLPVYLSEEIEELYGPIHFAKESQSIYFSIKHRRTTDLQEPRSTGEVLKLIETRMKRYLLHARITKAVDHHS